MSEPMQLRPEDILSRILDRERHQEKLNAQTVLREDPALHRSAIGHFGTWRRALKVAGINPDKICPYRVWDRKRVISKIQRLALGRCSLRRKDVYRQAPGLVEAAYRLFGTWQIALEAAGLNAEEFCGQPHWNREQILEAVLLRAVRLEPLGPSTVRPRSLIGAAILEFGSWSGALVAAGLEPKLYVGGAGRRRKYKSRSYRSREDVKRVLLQRHALGFGCDYESICKQDRRLIVAIRRFFGSCERARVYAGIMKME